MKDREYKDDSILVIAGSLYREYIIFDHIFVRLDDVFELPIANDKSGTATQDPFAHVTLALPYGLSADHHRSCNGGLVL
jgi:hypothetical protein